MVDGELPSRAEIKRFLIGRDLAAYKTPDEVRAVDSLPVTAVGKIDKKVLRAGA